MIITCPECATRYDVDDERFSAAGRSVRCTSCGEAWFVPAPEPIDVDPIEELTPAKRAPDDVDGIKPKRGAVPTKDHNDVSRENGPGRNNRSRQSYEGRNEQRREFVDTDDIDDGDEDDSLFGPAPEANAETVKGDGTSEEAGDDSDDREGIRGGFHGFGFAARRFGRSQTRDDDNGVDDGAPPFIKHQSRKEREAPSAPEEVVDAHWEDVDKASAVKSDAATDRPSAPETESADKVRGDRRLGFGRRETDQSNPNDSEPTDRRSGRSEIARLADVSPFDPEEFDEEFFTSLKVTPKALARALKTTRRRAERRQKNRLTPFRALGWTVWLAAVAGAAYGVVAYQDEIVKIAPKTADAYAIIGIEANPYGLAIENVQHRLAMSTAGPTIEISGKLKNMGVEAVAAPLLQAEALGPRGELLSRWTFSPNDTEVLEGATIDFITRAPAPDGVAEVVLSFAPAKSPVSELLSGRE